MENIHSQLLLEPGETLVGIYKTKKNSAWNTWDGSSEGENGGVALTNMRLLFYKEKGRLNKSYELFNTISLRDIMSVTAGGTIIKHVIVNGLKLFPEGANTQTLADLIRTTAQKVKMHAPNVQVAQVAPQQIQQIVNVTVPTTPPASSTPQAPATPAKEFIFCTKCGFQNEADANFCKKCGNPLN